MNKENRKELEKAIGLIEEAKITERTKKYIAILKGGVCKDASGW